MMKFCRRKKIIKLCWRCQKGSLLIEALLSVVILSVGITIIIHSMVSSLRASQYVAEYTQAVLVIENRLGPLIQARQDDDAGIMATAVDNKDKIYQLQLRPMMHAVDFSDLEPVRLSAQWHSGSRKNTVELDTFLLKEIHDDDEK